MRCILAVAVLAKGAAALENGLALTPPMGWMTWERFRCTIDCATDPDNCISEKLIQQHADIIGSAEWKDAGYEYLNIDDCWANMARTNGKLVGNATRFPSGMKALGDYVHKLGLKFGTYNDMGTLTCGKYPGECKDEQCTLPGYMSVDAATYAGWGIDSLKMDGCNSWHTQAVLDPAYIFMGEALNKTGRPMLYSCSWPDYIRTAHEEQPSRIPKDLIVNYTLTAQKCNIWRMYNDIQDDWASVTGIVDWVGDNAPHNGMLEAAGPGHFNDPDMLIIGNFGLSVDQAQAQMALWSIMAAPLLMGNDLRNLLPEMKQILLNKEVIAVDQDPLGKQGWRVAQSKRTGLGPLSCAASDTWMRPLAGGDIAVVLWNRGVCGNHRQLTVTWSDLKLPTGAKMEVRDLFTAKDLGEFSGSFTGFVNVDGVRMLRLKKA